MTDTFPIDDPLGLERLTYSKFYTTEMVRRPAQAPTKFVDYPSMVLPTGSILHTLEGLDTLVPVGDGTPNHLTPMIQNEKLPIWLQIRPDMADEESRPFPVDDQIIYRKGRIMPAVTHYYQHHRKYHRIMADRTIGAMGNVMTWLDYSALNHATVNGTLHEYRKFDALLRTMLDTVVKIGAKARHFLVFRQQHHVYGKNALLRTYSDLSTGTLSALKHDPSIFPILHILALAYSQARPLKVKPYKGDIRVFGKDSPILADLTSTSLFARIPSDLWESINLILHNGEKAVVYNLQDLVTFAQDMSFYPKLYRHIMGLRLDQRGGHPVTVDPDSDAFDDYVQVVAGGDDAQRPDGTDGTQDDTPEIQSANPSPVVTPSGHPPRENPRRPAAPISPKLEDDGLAIEPDRDETFEDTLRAKAKQNVTAQADTTSASAKKIDRHTQMIDTHLNAKIGDQTIGELIHDVQDHQVTPKTMDFVKSAPEESYKTTTTKALDDAYNETVSKRDMAKVVASLSKHGYYIQTIETDHVNTEMDRITHYKISLTDASGRQHTLRFKIPHVDKNGLMKIGGVNFRMIKQIANVPICKISPTRVSLASYYNKLIVERVKSKRHSYSDVMRKYITSLKDRNLLQAVQGSADMPTSKVAYDYTAIGQSFTEIQFKGYCFYFGQNGADLGTLNFDGQDLIKTLTLKYGTYVGTTTDDGILFWDRGNQIHHVDRSGNAVAHWSSFQDMLVQILGNEAALAKTPSEWVQASILNQEIPLIIILGFKYGLKTVLDGAKVAYHFYPKGQKYELAAADIEVKFNDGTLVFNRYPLSRSLLSSGLSWVDLRTFNLSDLNYPETYPRLIQQKKMTPGVLKGLNGFFDFFVDPITEQVLRKMREPTTFPKLLLRATEMLSDYHAKPSTSVELHRIRQYERLNGILYNEIFRALSNYNGSSQRQAFSINPEAVFQKIVQDATVSPDESINPVHEVKQGSNITFTGGGGRSDGSFVLRDRIYPEDGIGVISENVPDSGKVGVTAYLSASPRINDVHGIPTPYKDGDAVEAPQVLSIGSMLMPGGTTDDGKRNNYLSIQISHYVPNAFEGETLSVRTGYDEVLPHLVSSTFADAATDDGVVTNVDDKHKVITIQYRDFETPISGEKSTPHSVGTLEDHKRKGTPFAVLVADTDIGQYPMGGIFRVNKTTNGKIIDRLRCDSVDQIPDKDILKKYANLIHDFNRGRYQAVYYVRFQPSGIMSPGEVRTYSYDTIFSQISGSHIKQTRVANVTVGEKVKRGDVLVYNSGFFVPDPMSKQVTFKHGVVATIAMIEKSTNHEDAGEISRNFSKRLKMTPGHQRSVVTTASAGVIAMVKIGDHVETGDSLCVLSDDYLVQTSGSLDMDNIDIMEKLSRQTPSADYNGTIASIRMLYSCKREALSDTLLQILKSYEKTVRDEARAHSASKTVVASDRPGWVAPGTKYQGIDFDDDTVVLEFMIEETLDMAEGDKAVVGNQSKTVISYVSEKSHFTESGKEIDMVFSPTSFANRILSAAWSHGMAERVMETLKDKVLETYFED